MSQLNFMEHLVQKRKAFSVSELTARIRQLIEGSFAEVMVEGEISNFRRHSSGHWYFSLKDEYASVRCASFRMQNRFIRFRPEDGLTVRVRGRLSLYEARGEYQLLVDFIEPVGTGSLQLAFDQLKARLAAEGLFDTARKRPLPLLPRCVGVVTSPTGAAVSDILRIIKRRNEAIRVLIAPARVQGDGASQEIVRAINLLNSHFEVDVIVVGRGGGSIEDLWCFNEESVARAICGSRVPVISAVGHETDFTIADFVADIRASTPSAAAELVAKARDEISARITTLADRLSKTMRYRLLEMRSRLSELQTSRAQNRVAARLRAASQRLDDAVYAMGSAIGKSMRSRRASVGALAGRLRESDVRQVLSIRRSNLGFLTSRLESIVRSSLRTGRERLSVAAGKLDSISPLAVLGRGYAIAFDNEGCVIKRADTIAKGDSVRVKVAEGEMDCTRN